MDTPLRIAAGLIVGVAPALAWSGGATPRRAQSQVQNQPAQPLPSQFLESAWAYPGTQGVSARHGANIINDGTGQVWSLSEDNAPKQIGLAR